MAAIPRVPPALESRQEFPQYIVVGREVAASEVIVVLRARVTPLNRLSVLSA